MLPGRRVGKDMLEGSGDEANKYSLLTIFPITIDSHSVMVHNMASIEILGTEGWVVMLKIRLRRVGAKKKPSYRLVVADVRAPRDGAFIDIVGHYDPLTDPETIVIKEEKALHWLKQGAKPTDTTARLLDKAGILEKFKLVKEKS